jgi:ABC-type Fe3+/spermidine/putrescine transport system ATPase subunit
MGANVKEAFRMLQAAAVGPRARGQPKIAFAGVEKLYASQRASVGATLALDAFDLDIAPADIVSIVGPTGCGKSTALNILAGFEQPSSGSVSVDGSIVTGPGADRGVVFQQPSLFPWLTVRPVGAGERVRVTCGALAATVIAREPIPLCHKIGLDEIPAGSAVIKYGDPIGEASAAIQVGSHVHVHNLRSARARVTGDEARSNVPGTV